MKKLRRKLLLLSVIVCLSGLLYQFYEICNLYFRYPTRNKVALEATISIITPGFSSCFPLLNILDKPAIKIATGIEIYPRSDPRYSWTDYYDKNSRLTIGNIFNFTPPVNEIIDSDPGCVIRFPNDSYVTDISGTDCYQYFEITKYIHKEFMCYKLMPKPPLAAKLKSEKYLLSSEDFGSIYRVFWNKSYFDHVKFLANFAHEPESHHFFDSYSSRFVSVDPKNQLGLDTSYYAYSISMLKSPYDTDCEDYPIYGSQTQYFYSLVNNETMKQLGKILPEVYVTDKYSNMTLINPDGMRNETIRRLLNDLATKFKDKGKTTCFYRFLISKSTMVKRYDFGFAMLWPADLFMYLTYDARQELMDFIIYVFSCVGMWLGFSVFTCFNYLSDLFVKIKSKSNLEDEADIKKLHQEIMKLKRQDRDYKIFLRAKLSIISQEITLIKQQMSNN